MESRKPEHARRTREEARGDLDRIGAAILSECFNEAVQDDPRNVSCASLAHAVGLHESQVSRQLAGHKPPQMRVLLGMLERGAPIERVGTRVLAKLASRVGKVLADEPRVTDVLNDFHAFASLGEHAGRVLGEVGRALSDGMIDRREAREAIRALDALIECACSYRERLAAVADAGVDRVRGDNVVPYPCAGDPRRTA